MRPPEGAVFDATTYAASFPNAQGTVLDPRTGATTTTGGQNLLMVSQSSLDVDLHEIPIGLEIGRLVGRSTIALTGGGTINIVDLEMTSLTSYLQNGNLAFSRVSSSSDTPVKLGAYLGLNVTHPLKEDGSVLSEFTRQLSLG